MRSLVTLLGLLLSTSGAPGQTSREDVDFFETKIRPILVENCFACHSRQAKKQKGGLDLSDRQAIVTGGESGPAVMPGRPAESLLVAAISYRDTSSLQMPPKGKLPARDITLLEEWVRRGLPFASGSSGQKVQAKINIDEGRTFWSLGPLRRVEPGAIAMKGWPRGRVDHYLLAEMEKRGFKPSLSSERATLLRRLKFDLVGLPPTPEEVAEFCRATDRDAYARWVDRFLESPQHGERWARYWLDLVRYCDIPEPWADFKGQAHYYRDWVANALARDIPYDRFIRLQLAADLDPDARVADRAALGFLGLSPSYWKELQLPPEIIKGIVADEVEEKINAVSSTFLGLNAACARCHDHKYDPITVEDYYGLAGVIANSRQMDLPVTEGLDAQTIHKARETLKEYEAALKKVENAKTTDASEKTKELRAKIDDLKKAVPGWNASLAPGVVEASLAVEAAQGHGAKLVYKSETVNLAVQIRGDPNKPGPIVPRRFLTVFSRGEPFKNGSGRLELAQALVTDAASLTAGVIVNRVWKHHFGIGLVETPSDFGSQGDRPSHPELLDDLASRFIDNGWSLRWLHREIVLSAAYQQASDLPLPSDSENRLLSRFPRRKLDVEAWRDAILAASGTLELSRGGPSQDLSLASNRRRTLYGTVKRRELTDLLRLHDFPDPVMHSPSRVPTTTPLQQLFVFNSPLLLEQSSALMRRLQADAGSDAVKKIDRAYRLLFARPPRDEERALGLEFVKSGSERAWQHYAQVLLGSNEFLFVD